MFYLDLAKFTLIYLSMGGYQLVLYLDVSNNTDHV